MEYTTIKMSRETKLLLDTLKPENKSYEDFIKELLDLYIDSRVRKNEKLRNFLKRIGVDIKQWTEILIKAYKKLGIKDLERLFELDPEMAKKIIKLLKNEGNKKGSNS